MTERVLLAALWALAAVLLAVGLWLTVESGIVQMSWTTNQPVDETQYARYRIVASLSAPMLSAGALVVIVALTAHAVRWQGAQRLRGGDLHREGAGVDPGAH